MTEQVNLIPARLKSAVVGGHVAGADQIIDDNLGKTQNTINAETNSKFEQIDNEIEGFEKQDVVPVDTLPDVATADPKKVYRVVDETTYTDYMVNATGDGWKKIYEAEFPGIDDAPTAGSENLVKSGGVRIEMDKFNLGVTKLVIQSTTTSQIIEFPYNVNAISNQEILIQVDSNYIDNNPIYLYENTTSGTYHEIRNHQSYKITFGNVTKLILYIPNISQILGEGDVMITMQLPNNISLKLDGLAGNFNTITGSGQYIKLATNISKDSFFAIKLNSSGTFPIDIWAEYSDSTYKKIISLNADDVNNIRIIDAKHDINTLYINNNVTNIDIEFGKCDNSNTLVAAVEDTRKLLNNFNGNNENINITTRGLLIQDKDWMKQNMRVKFTLLACNSNNISIQVYIRKDGSSEDVLLGNLTEIGGTFYDTFTDNLSQVYFYSNYPDATEYTIRVDWIAYSSFNSDLYNRIYSPKLLSSKIFARVGCIGDSYTSGHIDISGTPSVSNPQFAWPKFMECITGRIYTNFGVSGSTAKQWVEGQANLSQVQAQGNKCQAYIIGLMLNDVSTSNPYYTPVGTVSDIGTNADTYYAYYYRLIQLVIQVNPSAKVFCLTCPAFDNNFSYNQAVRDVVAYCNNNNQDNVILCDLASDRYNNIYYFKNSDFLKDKVNGHFTAIGYEYIAECLSLIFSDVIIGNEVQFRDVYSIPYDTV